MIERDREREFNTVTRDFFIILPVALHNSPFINEDMSKKISVPLQFSRSHYLLMFT